MSGFYFFSCSNFFKKFEIRALQIKKNSVYYQSAQQSTRLQSKMRECWNWQTGMTKDHVLVGRAGSSPAFRIE